MDDNKGIVEIDVKEDGVYLTINNPESGPKVTRKQVLDLVESYGVQELDFHTINSLFKSEITSTEVKISANPSIIRYAETVEVEVSKDKMEATVLFRAPVNQGDLVTLSDLKKAVEGAGIRYGLIPGILEKLIEKHDYDRKIVIAKSKQAVNGVNGYLDYNFDETKKNRRPKELENGKVDFRKLNLIELTKKGDVLVTGVPPVPGVDGINVLGQILTARPGKPTPPLVKGKNVSESEDGKRLIADVSGQIILEGKKVSVSPVLEIRTDVDNSTGDIDFLGSVIINGNVRTGFTVKATGNIEVSGVVEGAKIKSNQSVFCYSGVQGNDKAEIIAGQDITAKFVEGCYLECGRDIIADCIMHSNAKCTGSIILAGRKGLLVGGKFQAREKIKLKNLGSHMATYTELEVGFDPEELDNYRGMTQEFKITMDEFKKIEKVIEVLRGLEQTGNLSEEKKYTYLKAINNRTVLREKLNTLQKKIDEFSPMLNSQQFGIVEVSEKIYPGVKLLIGNAMLQIRDEMSSRVFKNDGGRIVYSTYIE